MGNKIFIENKKVCVKPLRTGLKQFRSCSHQKHLKEAEICKYSKFNQYVLPRVTKTTKTHI